MAIISLTAFCKADPVTKDGSFEPVEAVVLAGSLAAGVWAVAGAAASAGAAAGADSVAGASVVEGAADAATGAGAV